MTFTNLEADVFRRSRYQSTPASAVNTRIAAFINEVQQELASDPRLSSLLRGETTLTTVAATAEYALTPQIGRIVKMRDTTNRWALRQGSLDWYRRIITSQANDNGSPSVYIPLGPKPISAQPAAATGVWAASSNAGDTTQTVAIEAIRTGGYYDSVISSVLTGVTRLQIGARVDYVELQDFYLSATAVGDVTLFDAAAAGNILGVIPKGQTRTTYQWIGLAPTPSAALTYAIDYERHVTDLVDATDEPYWLPARFHRLLAIGARKKEYEYQDSDRLPVAEREYAAGLLSLLAYVNAPPDLVLIPGAPSVGRSDLGGFYPAGTIWD